MNIWYVLGIVLNSLIIITVSLLISLLRKHFKNVSSSTSLKFPKKLKRNFQPTQNVIQLIFNTSIISIPFAVFMVNEPVTKVTQMRCLRRRQTTGILNFDHIFGAQQYDFNSISGSRLIDFRDKSRRKYLKSGKLERIERLQVMSYCD